MLLNAGAGGDGGMFFAQSSGTITVSNTITASGGFGGLNYGSGGAGGNGITGGAGGIVGLSGDGGGGGSITMTMDQLSYRIG